MKDIGIQLDNTNDTAGSVDLKVIVIRDNNNLITQGLIVGNILNQNQAAIIVANPGEFIFNPTVGAAIDDLLLDDDYLRMRHRIREHLTKDGMKVKSIELSKNEPLKIEALYE